MSESKSEWAPGGQAPGWLIIVRRGDDFLCLKTPTIPIVSTQKGEKDMGVSNSAARRRTCIDRWLAGRQLSRTSAVGRAKEKKSQKVYWMG